MKADPKVSKKSAAPLLEIFSSGGGTQSSAIAVLILQGKLPKPDMFVIADTRREMPTTWKYLDEIVRPAMRDFGVTVYRVDKEEWSYSHNDLWNRKGTPLMPVFTDQNGTVGKLSNYCSTYWKIDSVDNFVRSRLKLRRPEFRKWIGYSANEISRALRMMQGEEFSRGLIRFPLIHDIRLNRWEAAKLVENHGWPRPPRSRCSCCPLQTNDEWLEVKVDHPEEFQKAIELENQLREKDPHAWLHRECIPLNQVDFTKEEDLFARGCDSGNCFL